MGNTCTRDAATQCKRQIWRLVLKAAHALRQGKVRPEELLIQHRLSRELDAYRSLSAGAKAARMLLEAGKERRPGQMIKFLHLRGGHIHAWDLGFEPEIASIDVGRYLDLMIRAVSNIVQVLGIGEDEVRRRVEGSGLQPQLFEAMLKTPITGPPC